jgi:hypothetical protein
MCFGADAPEQWSALSDAERSESELATSACVIHTKDESAFFVRGHIEIPVVGLTDPFVWGVWVSLSEKNFERTIDLWETEGRETEPPYFGWLCTRLPVYPDTLLLKSSVLTQPVGDVPIVRLVDHEHPLAIDQRDAVPIAKVVSWAEQLLHG